MTKKYNYSRYEQAKFLKILKDNNIVLQHESPENLLNALNEIILLGMDSYKKNFAKYSYINLFYQHDVSIKKISGYTKVFKYFNLMMFDDKIINHVDKLISALTINNGDNSPLDITELFLISYNAEHKQTGYTFFVYSSVHDMENSFVEQIFNEIEYKEVLLHKTFRLNSDICVIRKLIYNNSLSLEEIGYGVSPSVFMKHAVMEKYKNYKNLYDFIQNNIINTYKYIDITFKIDNADYISLEFAVDNVECLDDILNCDIINEDQKIYIEENKKTKEAAQNFHKQMDASTPHVVKLEWFDADNLKVKWFNLHVNNET